MKKKMILRFTSIFLLLGLVVGCSGDKEDSTKNTISENTEVATDWQSSFKNISGITLETFLDSEAEISGRTVTFKTKASILEEDFKNYAQEVWDACATLSPEGIYNINYETFSKGNSISSFLEYYSEGTMMSYWYYTFDNHITQIAFEVIDDTLTITINNVYNAEGKLVKP
jgi:hypothetical protein